jgi:geranylgeranyl diphosphate synthase type II
MDIKAYINERAERVGAFLDSYFRPHPDTPPILSEAMRYSLMAGGKRIRPVLAMAACEAVGGDSQAIVRPVTALEVIHTYSLIHDDLPAMDDDDLRRGKPTNHKVYGEAVAILAGDGLLSEAFLMILDAEGIARDRLFGAARELSVASGPRGMVGGQVQDMLSEETEPDRETLEYIHTHKTGALLAASVRFGGILAGASPDEMAALSEYGEDLGLAFQIVDDVLDITGDEAILGKPVGSDVKTKKMTYPALYGVEVSRRMAEGLVDRALAALARMPGDTSALRELALYVLRRQY